MRTTESPRQYYPDKGLHVVATPIGNLGDMSARALRTLECADVIASEDTRVTAKLLRHFGITTPQTPYHEHNAERVRPELIKRLKQGDIVALVSDAGTPLISDPGYRLVRDAVAEGILVTSVPGPSATLSALVLSALPTDRFLFAGFLPNKSAARRASLQEVADVKATLVFFEAGARLAASLSDMAAVLGRRDAAIAREMTKLHEEVRRGDLQDLADHYADSGAPKGEIVVVVGPPEQDKPLDDTALDAAIKRALNTMTVRDAAAAVAGAHGIPRRRVYARALEIADEDAGADD